jgi:23S rRNA (adenine2030-N6)-methyltransferase
LKYRHAFHAGNFADVHKHVLLVALLRALARKDKGFLYVDTHAGRGRHGPGEEATGGIERLLAREGGHESIRDYAGLVGAFRREHPHAAHDYPGSPLIASMLLRPQDRGVAIESQPAEFEALRSTLGRASRVHAEHGDGWERLRALLPPVERRGLVLVDPPYEETREDFRRIGAGLADALARFGTGVFATWYPIKAQRDTDRWLASLGRALSRPAIGAEFWVRTPDARVALNGSGLLVVNPPWQFDETAEAAQRELVSRLGEDPGAGARIRPVSPGG